MSLHAIPAPTAALPRTVALGVRVRRTLLTAGGFAVLAGLLYAKQIPCMFAFAFHHPCPGCGSTRACLALLSGDLGGVVRMNPLGPVAAIVVGGLALQSLVSVAAHGDFRDAGNGRVGAVLKHGLAVLVVLEVLLWIARFFGAFGGPVPV